MRAGKKSPKPSRRRRQPGSGDRSAAARASDPSQPGQRQPRRPSPELMGRIKVGISSWTEPTLVKSGWYPAPATTAEDRLRYYASKFPIVEVDSTFYAIPNEKTAELWVARKIGRASCRERGWIAGASD